MAVLTAAELARLRNRSEPTRGPVNYTRGTVDAAFQAIEDYNVGSRSSRPATSLDAAIEIAAPGVFSARQKDSLSQTWDLFNGSR